MNEPTRDYIIVLKDRTFIPLKLAPTVSAQLADDWKLGHERGAYVAFDADDVPFTVCLRLTEVSAITAHSFTPGGTGAPLTTKALIAASQR